MRHTQTRRTRKLRHAPIYRRRRNRDKQRCLAAIQAVVASYENFGRAKASTR